VLQKKLDFVHVHGLERKATRARIFADFLVALFGRSFLNAGSGVLDVAGSGGDVSFQLWVRHGVRATVVDPRDPQKPTRQQKVILKATRRAKALPSSATHLQSGTPTGPPPRITTAFAPSLLHGGEDPNEYCSSDWCREPRDSEAASLLLGCSAVVGMHPDQATEPIVDFATALGKPFAVVPCCVFSHDFPHRRLPSGEPVYSFEQFIEYLCLKHPRINCTRLPLQGANIVLWQSRHTQPAPITL